MCTISRASQKSKANSKNSQMLMAHMEIITMSEILSEYTLKWNLIMLFQHLWCEHNINPSLV